MKKDLLTRRSLFKGSIGALVAGATSAGVISACSNNKEVPKTNTGIPLGYADSLIIGNVITVDEKKPEAQAITVKDNIITYVGDLETAKSLCNSNTTIMDYTDKFIYPGFMDYHTHPTYSAMFFKFLCNLYNGRTKEECLKTFKDYVKEKPDDKFYAGIGWVYEGFKPLAKDLDEICNDKMIVLMSFDLHSAWLNSKAMELLNINKEYARKYDPDVCEVDEDGNPTGCLNDNAAIDIGKRFFEVLNETENISISDLLIEGMHEWQEFCFKWGFTAVGDASLKESHVPIYAALSKDKKWKLRTFGSYYIDENEPDKKSKVEQCIKLASENNSEYFKIMGLKFFLDGVVDLKTAWLTEPYTIDPSTTGVPRMHDYDELLKCVIDASNHNMNVQLHSIGDGATKFAVEVFKQAAIETHNFDQRNAIAHLQLVRDEDIKNIADINAIAPAPFLWISKNLDNNYYDEVEVANVGSKRAESMYPVKSLIDAGACVVYHSDFPVSNLFSPLAAFYMAITRQNEYYGPPSIRGEKEKISRYDALKCLTKNIAYAFRQEDKLGTITPGKIANFTVIECNLLKDDPENIGFSKIFATIVDGEEVYHC